MRAQRLFVDQDGVLANYEAGYNLVKEKSPEIEFPQSTKGFFKNLDEIPDAISAVNTLRRYYDTYILTAPSVHNPDCYTDKRLWIEDKFDLDFCNRLIICGQKDFLRGDILIDDNIKGKGQDRFKGRVIHFGSNKYPNWDAVLTSLIGKPLGL